MLVNELVKVGYLHTVQKLLGWSVLSVAVGVTPSRRRSAVWVYNDGVKLSEEGWKGGAVSLISYCTFLALRVCHVVPALTNRNEFLTTTTRSQPIVLLSFVSAVVASGQRKEVETENDEGKN